MRGEHAVVVLTIGLTGGIASGKSTVSNMLTDMGIPVIDADLIARKVVEPGEEAYKKIVETFGKDILHPNLSIDRVKLGSIIFNDENKRLILNQIVHPAVRQKMLADREDYIAHGEKTVILDIPLLFESKLTKIVDRTILVYVDREIQLKRLMERNNFSKEEAEARINSQMPLVEKVQMADEVLNNNGDINETKKQLVQLLHSWDIKSE